MHSSFYFLIPVVLAATCDLATVPVHAQRSAISAETEFLVLAVVAVTLTVLLVVSSLMTTHPEIGTLIAEYNQF